jgi:magnesium transporter
MFARLVTPEIQELIALHNFKGLRESILGWTAPEIAELIEALPDPDDLLLFRFLSQSDATDTFEYLSSDKQQDLIEALAKEKDRLITLLNDLSPDDRTALLEELPGPVAQRLLQLLTPEERRVAVQLLGYPEESIGRLMTTEYLKVRPQWTIYETLEYIRRNGRDSETLNVLYVVDQQQRLVDDIGIRSILLADPHRIIQDLMDGRFISLKATDDQETAVQVFQDYDRTALPVTDSKGALLGIVTIDDVMDVAVEEATEDFQKIGAVEALDDSYLDTSLGTMIIKRARWLVLLFLGELLTASAMGYFEDAIVRAVVLALFIPLIISSGGNSGSQAATLIIRAMAIGEITLRDWWRVMRREAMSGLSLGAILGLFGVLRIYLWEVMFHIYGPYWLLIGITVGISLMGVVLWGTLTGSMLPFLMRRLGADPATSSAPFVATLVDVTGLLLYFSAATLLLSGKLL